jgi:hypothetical protein
VADAGGIGGLALDQRVEHVARVEVEVARGDLGDRRQDLALVGALTRREIAERSSSSPMFMTSQNKPQNRTGPAWGGRDAHGLACN